MAELSKDVFKCRWDHCHTAILAVRPHGRGTTWGGEVAQLGMAMVQHNTVQDDQYVTVQYWGSSNDLPYGWFG